MQEHSGPPMPPPTGSSWDTFIEEHVLKGPDEVDIKSLKPGDQLILLTKNTRYEFDWLKDGVVVLRTNRADRPSGIVSITGCVFRRSGTLSADVIFRGGKLQFTSMDGQVQHETTLIVSMLFFRQGKRCSMRRSDGTDTKR